MTTTNTASRGRLEPLASKSPAFSRVPSESRVRCLLHRLSAPYMSALHACFMCSFGKSGAVPGVSPACVGAGAHAADDELVCECE